MATPRIYHNPRCSKSRATLALLQERGLNPDIVEYLKDSPSADELKQICDRLGIEPVKLIRTGEARFKELGLSVSDKRSADEWCRVMADNPILIERPIVLTGEKAAVGRPPENVLAIL